MDNFIKELRKEVTERSITENKSWAHIELLYIGPYNAMYLTPARIDFYDDGVIALSNYSVCQSVDVSTLRNRLTDLNREVNGIRMDIYREDDGKCPEGIRVYSEECKSFFRMDSDTLVLTNIDINSDIKNPFVKLVINKLIGKTTERIEYTNPHKVFSVRKIMNKEE